MPAGYEKMREKFIREGMSRSGAQGKAARIWNSEHPDNPVGKREGTRKSERGTRKKKKGKGK